MCNVPGIFVDSQNHESHKIQSELEDRGLAQYSTNVQTSMIKHLSSFFENIYTVIKAVKQLKMFDL